MPIGKAVEGWQNDKPTSKQLDAISNMKCALHWDCEFPKTKGECCKLIAKMKEEISNRLSITGHIRPVTLMVEDMGEEDEDYYGFSSGDMIVD